jgi:STE24 endopeptidase
MLTYLFLLALIVMVTIKLWLAHRQIRHVAHHRHAVPERFTDIITLDSHQKAADYTVAKTRLSLLDIGVSAALLLGFTLLGGLHWLNVFWLETLGPGYAYGVALIGSVVLIGSAVDLPFSLYSQFRIEERYGFNKMTLGLYVADLAKSTAIGIVLGAPLLLVVLWLMEQMGSLWWIWTWLVWMGFNLLLLVLYPTVIAPLFNKFEPLEDSTLRQRIEALLKRCGFASKGLFVMDGSRRSAHGNAYFTGFGAAKRIVFFDTLLNRLDADEVEAVLAHELGHFKRRHILKRILVTFTISLGVLAMLGWLAGKPWFYTGLGVAPNMMTDNNALALVLFFLTLPVFTFLLGPIASLSSRKHEFEADAYAAEIAQANHLVSALVKLYKDNASTLTPDPLYSAFYYSHPPASQRIARLEAAPA